MVWLGKLLSYLLPTLLNWGVAQIDKWLARRARRAATKEKNKKIREAIENAKTKEELDKAAEDNARNI